MGKETTIGVVALGKSVDQGLMDALASSLCELFGLPVEASVHFPAPHYAFQERRGQYHSTAILNQLKKALEGVYDRTLGVADVDLFVPSLNFVFGEADLLHGVAVISLFRLRPESYGLPSDSGLLQERALKEAVHELGHTFGLMHCGHWRCVMHFSNSLADTDRKGHRFCWRCRDSLATALRSHSQQGGKR
ncbi:MAG: archaemetzincin family Zn-dependent metalloprotease [candidate division NC10 bacterium]|nr:archaemetzincin family Zn-dependent metalloprotease [candidate division NC10 bacterium]